MCAEAPVFLKTTLLMKVSDDYIYFTDQLGVLESVKAAADVNIPVGGCVVEINEKLDDSPELINQDSYKEGMYVRTLRTMSICFHGVMMCV